MILKAILVVFLVCNIQGLSAYNNEEIFRSAIDRFKNGDYEKSASILNGLVTLEPSEGLYWFNLGNAYFMMEDFGKAVSCYIKVIKLKSGLSMPARLYLTRSYRLAKRLDYALTSIRPLIGIPLPDSLSEELEEEKEDLATELFSLGMEAYGDKRYGDSIGYFDGVLSLGHDADSRMIKAFALLKSGKVGDARTEFELIRAKGYDKISDEGQRADAEYFLRQIDEGKWERFKPYWLYADVWAGYDSNVYNDGSSEAGVSRPSIQLRIGTGVRFFEKGSFGGRIAYNLSWEEYPGLSYLRLITNKARLPLNFDNMDWRVQAEPFLQHEFLDMESFLFKAGTSLRVEKYFRSQTIGLNYEYTRNIPILSNYDYLEGNVHSASLYWQYRGSTYMIGPNLTFLRECIGDLLLTTGTVPLANISFGPGINTWWEFVRDLRLSLGWAFLLKYYDGATSPDGQIRDDKYLNGYLKLAKGISHKVELFVESVLRINWSTLGASSVDDKNYRQFIVFGGLSWNILP